ncbi:hypothetical protein V6N11_067341 [Hibiscus sabdariffa]|uniref:Uncharacterized protein n=1 Tax=Hibiscus sabdariffa TaxID=183260 RepID=A0ABR2SQG0_9ROSI
MENPCLLKTRRALALGYHYQCQFGEIFLVFGYSYKFHWSGHCHLRSSGNRALSFTCLPIPFIIENYPMFIITVPSQIRNASMISWAGDWSHLSPSYALL